MARGGRRVRYLLPGEGGGAGAEDLGRHVPPPQVLRRQLRGEAEAEAAAGAGGADGSGEPPGHGGPGVPAPRHLGGGLPPREEEEEAG